MTSPGLRLVRLTPDLESAFRDMRADYAAAGEARHERIAADFAGELVNLDRWHRGEAPTGLVPASFYWLLDDEGRMLGGCRLRHALNENLWQDGGHIGYDVRPSQRNRGLATRMLALGLEKARDRGLEWVLLTVDPSNTPSIRVIEKNGGLKIGQADRTGNLRFRIDLA